MTFADEARGNLTAVVVESIPAGTLGQRACDVGPLSGGRVACIVASDEHSIGGSRPHISQNVLERERSLCGSREVVGGRNQIALAGGHIPIHIPCSLCRIEIGNPRKAFHRLACELAKVVGEALVSIQLIDSRLSRLYLRTIGRDAVDGGARKRMHIAARSHHHRVCPTVFIERDALDSSHGISMKRLPLTYIYGLRTK